MKQATAVVAVVDNDDSVRRALDRLLRSSGYRTEMMASGQELLQEIANRHMDCVILDLHMSFPDGFEVLRRLAAGVGPFPAPPVVVLTGHDSPESRACVADTGGAHAFLRKPVDKDALIDAIESAIGGVGRNETD